MGAGVDEELDQEEEEVSDEGLEETPEEEIDPNEELTQLRATVEQLKQDSELLEEIMSNPKVRQAILEEEGEKQPTEQESAQPIDPNDPIAALRTIIREEVSSIVGNQVQGVIDNLAPLMDDRMNRELEMEYNNLAQANPRVNTVGYQNIVATMQKHPTLNMYQASQVALADPTMRVRPATTMKIPPRVSSSTRAGTSGTEEATEGMSRLRQLQEAALKAKQSKTGIGEIIMKRFGRR